MAGVAREGGSWAGTNSAGGCGAWWGRRCRVLRVRVTEGAGCPVKETRVSPPESGIALVTTAEVGQAARVQRGERSAQGESPQTGGDRLAFSVALASA